MEIEDFFVEPLKDVELEEEFDLGFIEKEVLLGFIREFEEKTGGMTLEEYKESRKNGGEKKISIFQVYRWEDLMYTLARLEQGEILHWLEFGHPEGIPVTKEGRKEEIEEWEESAGMTVEEYKQAIAAGEIKNYSMAELSMIERDKKWVKEMEERGE